MPDRNYYRNMHPRVSREEYDKQVAWNAAYIFRLSGKKPEGKTIIFSHISEVAYYPPGGISA